MLKKKTRKKIIIFVLAAAAILLFWSSTTLQEQYNNLVAFFNEYVTNYPILSIFLFLLLNLISVLFLFFSSSFMVPIAVSIWGGFTTTMLLLGGWILGAIFSYLIGRFAGYPLLRYFISDKKLNYYNHLFSENSGLLSIFLLRFTLPSEIPGYLLGIFRFNFVKYLLITILAEIPYAFITVYAFDAILRRDPLTLGLILGTWLIATAILIKLIYKKIKKNKIDE